MVIAEVGIVVPSVIAPCEAKVVVLTQGNLTDVLLAQGEL